jgi:hypothetical protein
MAVKLNMSKAYNHVEWRFLEETTKRMGFAPWWTQLIMMCVTMVQYAVAACRHIQPARGIRQGDPISSYMFLICAKILSSMLSQANQGGALTGVPILKKGPRISLFFFFFADNSLLLCKANIQQWTCLTSLLRQYEETSGQQLNSNKTTIFFFFFSSKNTSMADKERLGKALGIPITQCYD